MIWLYLLLGLVTYFFIITYTKQSTTPKGLKPLPEAPGKLPFFGHFLSLGKQPHKLFAEWSKVVGDLYVIHVGVQPWIILNNDRLVNDLLQKRGAKYSSRPPSTVGEVFGRNRDYVSSAYNEWFKNMMPITHGILSVKKIDSYSSMIEDSSRNLLLALLDVGELPSGIFPKHYYFQSNLNIILSICFGFKTKGIHDPLYIEIERLIEKLFEISSLSTFFASFFPILKVFQWNFVRKTVKARDEWERLISQLLQKVKDNREKLCVARDLLEKVDEGVIEEVDASKFITALFSAGSETTSTTLLWLTAVLANNPEIQSRAHEELDRVVGRSRLPNLQDRQSLPYIDCIIKEILRWAPPAPNGLLHYIEEDDEYMGYHIPKNSFVSANIFALNSDEKKYENPDVFDPDRFRDVRASSSTLARGKVENRDHFAFGAGRRLCIGINMAESSLQIFVSNLLWAYRIENPVNENGKSVPVDMTNYTVGLVQTPNDYHVRFIPRHENVKKVLRQ